jgi:hypothetical protein
MAEPEFDLNLSAMNSLTGLVHSQQRAKIKDSVFAAVFDGKKKSSIVIESCESQTDHIETLAISLRLKDAKLVYAFTSIMIHDTFCIWS